METAVIKFKDGTEISVEANGSCFIVDAAPVFPSDFTDISIIRELGTDIINYGQLVECASVDGRYWFSIIEIPEQERAMNETNSKIEYIAMMTDIDIDTGV